MQRKVAATQQEQLCVDPYMFLWKLNAVLC